jgi:hypothetical protein
MSAEVLVEAVVSTFGESKEWHQARLGIELAQVQPGILA